MKKSKKIILGSLITSLLLVGCGSSSSSSSTSNNSSTDTRFTTMTVDTETVEIDTMKKLEWIGSSGKNMNACQPHAAATTEVADVTNAKEHCTQLTFATYTDWRVATAEEHQEHVTAMETAGKTPFYQNPSCPRVIGVNDTTAKAVNTHNSSPVGAMTTWADLINSSASNYGLKCVRNQ